MQVHIYGCLRAGTHFEMKVIIIFTIKTATYTISLDDILVHTLRQCNSRHTI